MSGNIGSIALPPVSDEFIKQLEDAYPQPTLVAGFDRDKALWDAACASVVTWIKAKAAIKVTMNPVTAQRAAVRYGS